MQQGSDQDNQDQNKPKASSTKKGEMSTVIMQQPSFRRPHEESGQLPPLSSMLPPLPPLNPRSMPQGFSREGLGKPPSRDYSERSAHWPEPTRSPPQHGGRSVDDVKKQEYSSVGGVHPHYEQARIQSMHADNKPFAFGIHSTTSPPLSATTRPGSDSYNMEDASTASSSSLRAPSQHFYRSRTRSSAMPYEVSLPSPSAMDIFNQLWEVMLEIRKYSERFQRNNQSGGPRPLPSIRDGDVTTLMSHLQYEIDILAEHDARTADHFALDVRHLHDQYTNQAQQARSRPSTISMPNRRERSSHPCQHTPHHAHGSSSLSPPAYTLSASAPRARQITPSSGVNEHMYSATAPSSAPAFGRGHDSYPAYDHYGREHGGMNERKAPHSGYGSGYGTGMYDNRGLHTTSAPPSPQDKIRPSSTGHLPGSYYHAMSSRTPPSMPRRVRKRRDEAEQSCLSCSAKETPEWRKGPTGPRTLCNACGLLFAKQCRKREMELQARGKRPKGARVIGPEEMTQEERENSLLELQMAVQARVNQTNSNVSGLPTVQSSLTAPQTSSSSPINGMGNHSSFSSHHHYHHHQHHHNGSSSNHVYDSPSLERSSPSAGGHHVGMPRMINEQPSPPSLPPLLRQG